MSKTPPTTSQKITIFQDALKAGESEEVARSLARANTPVEHKQLTRYIELIEGGTNRKIAAEMVNLRPHQLASLMKRHPDYAQAVEEARHRYMESLVDQLPTLGEGAETPVELGLAKLKSDNYKWLAAKYMPKQYGDRMAVEIDHKINLTAVLLEAESRIIPVVGSVVTDGITTDIPDKMSEGDRTLSITDADFRYVATVATLGESSDEDMFS